MRRAHRLMGAVVVTAFMITSVHASRAASWRFSGSQAGLWADGGFNGFVVSCGPGGVSLEFFGFPARLESGMTFSVVVTVDGTARRFRTKAAARRGAAGSTLSTTLSAAATSDFLEALRRGKKAEIATPAGLYALPLAGSSKALDALRAVPGCRA